MVSFISLVYQLPRLEMFPDARRTVGNSFLCFKFGPFWLGLWVLFSLAMI